MPDLQARAASIFAGLTFRLVLLGIIALLLVNTYVSVRIPLPLLPDIHFEGWKPKAQRLQGVIDDFDQAQADALAKALAAKAEAEREYRDLAERIDNDAEKARAGILDATERFIAANRVCPPDRGSTGGTPAPAPDRSPGDGQGPGQAPELDGTLVAVKPDDVRICTVNTLQAEAAREWALELEAGN